MSATELGSILFPIWLPLLIAPLVYLLRQQALGASLVSAGAMLLVGVWLGNYPPTEGMTLWGRALFLSPVAQTLLVALALWLAVAFLFAGRISQGWSLFPFLLTVYAIITAALFFEELVIQILLLKIAWLVIILLVQGGTANSTRAGTRLLILSVLSLPFFLSASVLITQQAFEPEASAQAAVIVLALGMGFALMLAIVPFHAWLPQVAEDGPPLVAAWLVAGMGGSYLILLLDLLGRYQWLAVDPQVQRLLLGGGLLLAVGGGLLTVTEQHLGRMWAYASLADLGYVLLALSFGSRPGMVAALLIIGSRLLNLLLAGGALATIRHRATTLTFDGLVGVGARLPLSMVALAIGGMAMFGAPLTAGFPGHWAVLRLMSRTNTGWTALLVIASVLGLVGFVRAFATMTTAPAEPESLQKVEGEPRLATLVLAGLAALSILLGLTPQLLDGLLTPLLRSLNF